MAKLPPALQKKIDAQRDEQLKKKAAKNPPKADAKKPTKTKKRKKKNG